MQRTIKACFRKLTRQFRVRIQAGPCEGLLWSLPTRMNFIRGVYEQRFARFIAATLRPDDVFWDVGAHFGYYSLLASRVVRNGECFSFEPNEDNRWYLEHHVQWNKLSNITTFPFAIAQTNGTRRFGATGTGAGKLDSGETEVQTRSIGSLVESRDCRAPSFLKVDVEGAEVEVLNGSLPHRESDMICVATHGADLHAECNAILKRNGYQVHDLQADSLLIGTGRDRTVTPEALRLISSAAQPA